MEGIVSLLDNKHYALIEQLWAELEQRFGVRGVLITPYPHFSYHVASSYGADEQTDIALEKLAQATAPFTVTTSGLGIFTGASPVLYLSVVRTESLSEYHHTVWSALQGLGQNPQAHYQPEHWMPHVTIGFGDMKPDKLAEVVPFLSQRNFNWTIPIDNLAHIAERGEGQKVRRRYQFEKE